MLHKTSLISSSIQSENEAFLEDVVEGLSAEEKSIPSKYLYDARGSQLFDEICNQPEYYPTRTEIGIMNESIESIAAAIGDEVTLVEFGTGSGLKTELLLEHCSIAEYVPIDISRDHLMDSAERLQGKFPLTRIVPVPADFTQVDDSISELIEGERRIVYFPGSTIGNFEAEEAEELLASMSLACEDSGGVLIGIDLQKDIDILEAAYNDANRVTDAFTLNLLVRMREELDAQVNVEGFQHLAFYESDLNRIEIYLESRVDQTIQVEGHSFQVAKGERIRTEYSHKYDVEEFARNAAQHGLELRHSWTDSKNWFALLFFEKVATS